MPKFVPLEISGIDEGNFLDEANKALQQAQTGLIQFVRKYGEAANGAKAVVNIAITIQKEDKGDDIYSIKATLQQKLPAVPPSLTMAMETEKDNGEPSLFVRASGSTADDPRQGVLCTQDGRIVDPSSGEIIDNKHGSSSKAS